MEPTQVDPVLWRGLTMRRMSRRGFLKSAGLGIGAISLSGLLEACSVSSNQSSNTGTNWDTFWKDHSRPNGQFNFANWPIYIDHVQGTNGGGHPSLDYFHNGGHPSLDYFHKQTGIQVNYQPVINENASFFATIEPSLQAGKDTGWDLMVISSDTLEQLELFQNGWLTPLDQSTMTNFRKYARPEAINPPYDPGNKYTMAWQSGFTGIGVNTKYVDMSTLQHSWKDLWNPKFKSKVGMFADADEIGSAALLIDGVQPSKSTPSDWDKAAQLLEQQNNDGIVRAYYEQGYITHLQDGDTWLSQAWSGDILTSQLEGFPELQFYMPSEGAMYWTDTMMIPLHAANPRDAMTYMDYVYQPLVQAMIDDWVWYLSPVPQAQQVIEQYVNDHKNFYEGLAPDKAVASSRIVFPTPDLWKHTRNYYQFKNISDAQHWNSIFQPIYQS